MKKHPEIEKELRENAPGLVDLPAYMPFSVPESYFEAPSVLASQVIRKADGSAESGKVPQHYFEDFADRLMLKLQQPHDGTPVQQKEKIGEPARILSLWNQKWMQIAASVLLLAGVFSIWKFLPQNNLTGTAPAITQTQTNWVPDAIMLTELELLEQTAEHRNTGEEFQTIPNYVMDKSAELPSLEGYSLEDIQKDLEKIAFLNGG